MKKNTVIHEINGTSPTTAVSCWMNTLDVRVKDSAAGGRTVGALSRKAWKDETGSALTGNALKRAHNAYLREVGLAGNAFVAGLIAEGKIAVSSIGTNKTGTSLSVKFANAATIVDPVAKEAKATKATIERGIYAKLLADGKITQEVYDNAMKSQA